MSTLEKPRSAGGHSEELQRLADRFFDETGAATATAKDIAVWAIREGHWEPPPDLILRQCREEFAKAMREQYIKNGKGQPVRAKHVARIKKGAVQQHLWSDIRVAKRKHMEIAFQQRREQIVGECRQLSRDVDYYNESHSDEKPMQLCFDFREDVAEGEFSADFPVKSARPPQPR